MKSGTALNFLQAKLRVSETGFCSDFGAKTNFVPYLSLVLSACITAATFSML
jgi:hypothetical protein